MHAYRTVSFLEGEAAMFSLVEVCSGRMPTEILAKRLSRGLAGNWALSANKVAHILTSYHHHDFGRHTDVCGLRILLSTSNYTTT